MEFDQRKSSAYYFSHPFITDSNSVCERYAQKYFEGGLLNYINVDVRSRSQDRINQKWKKKMENGSILLAPQMRHILASLDSVASAAERIQKEA